MISSRATSRHCDLRMSRWSWNQFSGIASANGSSRGEAMRWYRKMNLPPERRGRRNRPETLARKENLIVVKDAVTCGVKCQRHARAQAVEALKCQGGSNHLIRSQPHPHPVAEPEEVEESTRQLPARSSRTR